MPISEARAGLGDLLTEAVEHEIYILRHGRPAGVLLSVDAYEAALARIEDLEDEVSVLRSRLDPDPVPFERSTPTSA
ncbi:type II toxin-antitoxin system Phd/YefM family antitoxin [Propionicicella superfundia]|uniref:type II toxin-antitoxin system Phd/YefM family antitoxin n=1 Tax=Propionicicella superfundia TaxID=348582 RepID=UPI00146AA3CF|nr:type II toxin-antitoxin system Phd/YefM family antitoxin [Propionicicella superfundia]